MRKNSINNGLGTIFVSYHKPFKILNSNIIVPIHAGRLINEESKDGKLKTDDIKWLTEKTIGDDSGDNISIKNREYC